ncbi:MAG: hypothetical protein KF861_05305 [Planctomycetaceae bacterium]|nr:hypothetical protein [Planctomycetaceae bacterium]
MTKFTSTLLGLTLVTACSASNAQAGLFDWMGLTPRTSAPRVASPNTNTYGANNSLQCGPNGCVPCNSSQCNPAVRTPLPGGYQPNGYQPNGSQLNGYQVQRPLVFPTNTYPVSGNPSTTFPVSNTYGHPTGVPYTTPAWPTQPQGAQQHNAGYRPNMGGAPYYGNY